MLSKSWLVYDMQGLSSTLCVNGLQSLNCQRKILFVQSQMVNLRIRR